MSISALLEFYKKSLPPGMRVLPVPVVMFREACGTPIEFLLRVYHEASDILRHGDSLVKEIPFTDKDIIPLLNGCDALSRSVKSGEVSEADRSILRNARQALETVSRYHELKIKAAETEISRLSSELSKARTHFKAARATGNVKALLEYYPELPGLLDLEALTASRFETEANVVDLREKKEQAANESAFHGTISEALGEADAFQNVGEYALSFTQMMGKPEMIERMERGIDACEHDVERNGRALEAIRLVLEDFSHVLDPDFPTTIREKRSGQVVPFKPAIR